MNICQVPVSVTFSAEARSSPVRLGGTGFTSVNRLQPIARFLLVE